MSVIVVLMGVAGSGKTAVGQLLAHTIHWPFLNADSLHSDANVDKMSRGIPLADHDRAGWLAAIHGRMVDASNRGQNLIVACSALRAQYRVVLAKGLPVTWVYLKASAELLRSRLQQRSGHFMKADMLESQLATLEEPSDAIVIDASQSPEAIVQQIIAHGWASG